MNIRPVLSSDADELAAPLSELGAATFAGTFGHLYAPEDLAKFLKERQSEDYYRNAIAAEDRHLWVLETDTGALGGYMELRPNDLPCEPPRPDALEFGRLYFLPEFQGQGWGGQFIEVAIEHARNHSFKEMVLSVFSENIPAQKLYGRHGFEKIGEYHFKVGDHLDEDWILLKTL